MQEILKTKEITSKCLSIQAKSVQKNLPEIK